MRAIGTFQADPIAVPGPLVAALARQLDITDPGIGVGSPSRKLQESLGWYLRTFPGRVLGASESR